MSKPPEDELIGVMYSDLPLEMSGNSANEAVVAAACPAWILGPPVSEPPMESLVGYEADRIHDPYTGRTLWTILDSPYRRKDGTLITNSQMTLYERTANTARVFGAGTNQWSWGLDDYNADPAVGPVFRGPYKRVTSQNIMTNIFGCLVNGVCS